LAWSKSPKEGDRTDWTLLSGNTLVLSERLLLKRAIMAGTGCENHMSNGRYRMPTPKIARVPIDGDSWDTASC
ncbi:MAG: hypothetical protein AAF802_27425, partial [Planctomycetota bacterium]